MKAGLEQTWVSVLDSPAWRRFGRSPVGRRPRASRAFRVTDTARRWVLTAVRSARRPTMFQAVRYAGQCRRLEGIRTRVPADRLVTVRYEDLVAAPAERLADVCRFLEVDAPSDYLLACARIVDPSRPGGRQRVHCAPPATAAVAAPTRQFSFLNGYTCDRADAWS